MNRTCDNCALFDSKNDKEGYCSFWRKDVPAKDYCVEFKEKKE